MVLNPKITNIPKEAFENMLDVTVDFVTENGTLLSNISWAFNSQEYNFAFLDPGEYLDIPYNIQVIDSDDVLLVDHDITITIIGTADSPIVFDLIENGADGNTEYLTTSGFLYYEGVNSATQYNYMRLGQASYRWDTRATLTVDTNAYMYDAVSVWEIPSNEDLLSMIRFYNVFSYGSTDIRDEVPEDYAVLRWDWDASRNSESTSFRGTTFDFLAEGEYMNLTYTLTFDDKLGYTDTREIIINISGTNDGPVITNKEENAAQARIFNFFNNINNPSEIDGSWYYHQGGQTVVRIEDVDHSDGEMSARIIDVFDLVFSQDYIRTFPEWPGIDKLRDAIVLSFIDQKQNYANTPSSIPDTNASLNVAFNMDETADNFIDFSFLGPGDDFSFKITVEVTDAKGDTDTIDIPITFQGWSDGNYLTVQLTGKESDESQEAIIVTEDNFDNVPHRIEVFDSTQTTSEGDAVRITIDRTYNPSGKTIYAFYEIEFESVDRSGPILYTRNGQSFGVEKLTQDFGWPADAVPSVSFAYNLSDTEKTDISKYTGTFYDEKINDIPLKRLGELVNTLNIMIEIPSSALLQNWPGFGGYDNFGIRAVYLEFTNTSSNRDDGRIANPVPLFISVVDLAELPVQE